MSKNTKRPGPVDYTAFVKTWRTSKSLKEVAKALGIKENSASAIASRLRGEGVDLQKFPRRVAQTIDVKALNRIAR